MRTSGGCLGAAFAMPLQRGRTRVILTSSSTLSDACDRRTVCLLCKVLMKGFEISVYNSQEHQTRYSKRAFRPRSLSNSSLLSRLKAEPSADKTYQIEMFKALRNSPQHAEGKPGGLKRIDASSFSTIMLTSRDTPWPLYGTARFSPLAQPQPTNEVECRLVSCRHILPEVWTPAENCPDRQFPSCDDH